MARQAAVEPSSRLLTPNQPLMPLSTSSACSFLGQFLQRRLGILSSVLFALFVAVCMMVGQDFVKEVTIHQDAESKPDIAVDSSTDSETLLSTESSHRPAWIRPVSDKTLRQIENYKAAKGLMINLHITHHGGTTFCATIGRAPDANGDSPSFNCMVPRDANLTEDFPRHNPWTAKETANNIAIARRYYHMMSWEYKSPPKTPIAETEWENENLLPVILMRNPIDRLLAGNGWKEKNYPNLEKNGTHEEWMSYANTTHGNTNNFALHVLAGRECCDGANTNHKHLIAAQKLVSRFSIVLDMACLDQGLMALADLVNITLAPHRPGSKHDDAKTRIGYDDVYDFLVKRNTLDIELYEWSKSISLVDCAKLPASGQ